MDVLVSTGQKSTDLVTITEIGNPLVRVDVSICNHFSGVHLSFTHEVHLMLAKLQVCRGDILELDLFVKHVHRCKETLLHVVLDIVISNLDLLEEGRECGAASSCEEAGLDIIWN